MSDHSWIFDRKKLSEAIYDKYKDSDAFNGVVSKIYLEFGDDEELIDFLLDDRPTWVCDGVGHYLEWLRVTPIYEIAEWAYRAIGRWSVD